MKRNRELEIHILATVRADEGLMSTVSYKNFNGITINEFVEHCRLLEEDGFIEARLAFGGVAHIRLTTQGHAVLDAFEQQNPPPSRKLGF